jgi:DHA2 family multidrug resistance protein
MNALSFATLAPRFRTDAASLLYLTRSLGGSAGIAVLIALFGTNLQTSHADLVQHVTGFSLSQVDPGMAQQLGAPGAAVLAAVDAEITRQAMMIAYLDDFAAMMWFAIASVPLVLLLRRRPAGLAG